MAPINAAVSIAASASADPNIRVSRAEAGGVSGAAVSISRGIGPWQRVPYGNRPVWNGERAALRKKAGSGVQLYPFRHAQTREPCRTGAFSLIRDRDHWPPCDRRAGNAVSAARRLA